jgi:hypothetical protein
VSTEPPDPGSGQPTWHGGEWRDLDDSPDDEIDPPLEVWDEICSELDISPTGRPPRNKP